MQKEMLPVLGSGLDASWIDTSGWFVVPHKAPLAWLANKNNVCIRELNMMLGRVIAEVFWA